MSKKYMSESQFYMWRALFALIHIDDEVHDQEVRFMAEVLEDNDFSEAQRMILNNDMHDKKDVIGMFDRVTDPKDQVTFFRLARDVVYADGDFGTQEKEIMEILQKKHMQDADIADFVGHIDLEIEGEGKPQPRAGQPYETSHHYDDLEDIEPFTFKKFFKDLFGK